MVQASLDTADTASLFRLNAEGVTLPAVAQSTLRLARSATASTTADNDEDEGFDEHGNSDQAILARKSGYRLTDETTMQGLQNEINDNSNPSVREIYARAGVNTSASSSGLFGTVGGWVDSAWDWASEKVESAWNWVSDTYSSVAESVGKFTEQYITQPFNSAVEGMQNFFQTQVLDRVSTIGTTISDAASKYIAEPVRNMASAISNGYQENIAPTVNSVTGSISNTFSTYVSNPVSNAYAAVTGWFSSTPAEQPAATPTAAAATPAQQTVAETPRAETQALAGASSNPTTGWSLGSMFQSAANAVGLGNDDPAPSVAIPAPAARMTMAR